MGMRTAEAIRRFRDFLRVRDGAVDMRRRTLAHREAFFASLEREPVRSSVRIDRETFRRNMAWGKLEPGLDERMIWLLATAKINQGESYAVALMELHERHTVRDDVDLASLHVFFQDRYHCRILAELLAMFGLPAETHEPTAFVRMAIKVMMHLPDRVTMPLRAASLMVSCAGLRQLRDRGARLFADEPRVASRIRLLYDQIIGDEIGNIGFIAARLGPVGRGFARLLYRTLGLHFSSQLAEDGALFSRAERLRRLREFRIERVVAEMPTLAFAAAEL
jgi:hypothetical protein